MVRSSKGPKAKNSERAASVRLSAVPSEVDTSTTRLTEMSIEAVSSSVASPKRLRALLTMIAGPQVGRVYTVTEGETVFGRDKQAHVRIDHAGGSRRHARIVATGDGRYVLEDLGSTNGTFVGGKRIEGQVPLASGDRIYLGPHIVVSFAILDEEAERLTHQLYESSVRDPLTRTFNRRYLLERLTSEVAYAKRHGTRLGVIMFDIDHFKRVNDTYGHLAGDDALRDVSALVQQLIRTEDVLARYGGEEFVVLVRGIEHANIGRFAERLRAAVEKLEIASAAATIRVTVSAGYASIDELPDAAKTPVALLAGADSRLYTAKTSGRNRTCGES